MKLFILRVLWEPFFLLFHIDPDECPCLDFSNVAGLLSVQRLMSCLHFFAFLFGDMLVWRDRTDEYWYVPLDGYEMSMTWVDYA
jgi:uncharacterized Tic20 family protein